MKSSYLFVLLFLLFSTDGCKSAAQDARGSAAASSKNNADPNVSAAPNQPFQPQIGKESEKISRKIVANDRRKLLQAALNAKLFQPDREVLLKFSQICEAFVQGKSLEIAEMETFDPQRPNAEVISKTIVYDENRRIVPKANASCDGEEQDKNGRSTVYADLKFKPIPIVKKKAQKKEIDERQAEYEVDEVKLSKIKLNDRKKLLAEAIRSRFSQLDAIAINEFSQVCELETGANVFFVVRVVYELHHASSDHGLEQVLVFDKENKIVNSFYTDFSPKFCDGDKLYLFNSADAAQTDGQEMSFGDASQVLDGLNVKKVKLKELPTYNDLTYKPV